MTTTSDPRSLRHWLALTIWAAAVLAVLVIVPGAVDGIRATWDAICAMIGSLLP